MKSCIFRVTLFLQAIAVVGAIGFVAPASVALAQPSQGKKSETSAAASKPGDVSGVVVQAPPKPNRIPPRKRAAFDAEAAKRKAWKDYRNTTPTATATAARRPGQSPNPENYPGLHSLASH